MDISNLVANNPYTAGAAASYYVPIYAQQQSVANLSQSTASYQTQISAYGQVNSALSSLQSAAQTLASPDTLSAKAAASSAPDVVSATASAQAAAGQYNVQVNQIALGETLISSAQQSSTASIGSGAATNVTFNFADGRSQSLAIGSGNNSLSGIASSINNANIGISAATTANNQLVLSGQAGAANAFSISVAGDATISNLLSHPPTSPDTGMHLVVAAQDAQASVNGSALFGQNSQTHAGISLQFKSQGASTVNVAPDAAQITGAVQAFVNAYNSLQNALSNQTLSADHALSTVRSQVAASVNVGALAQIGITAGQNGTLTLNVSAFQSALVSNASSVMQTFRNGGNGVAESVASATQTILQPGGAISTAVSGLQSRVQLDKQLQNGVMANANQIQQTFANEFAQLRTSLLNTKSTDQFLMSQLYQATQLQGMLPMQSLQLGALTSPGQVIYV